MTFGEKIRNARKAKDYTQKQLADKIGAKHNSVSDWENNKNMPDPNTIEYLCRVLEITPNYLLDASEEEFSPFEKLFIKKYRNLDDFGKESVEIVLNRESERVETISQQKQYIESLKTETSEELIPTRIISYCQRLASAGNGVYLFDDIPTDVIKVEDTPISRRADFAIGVNGDSMEPDYFDGEKVFVEKTPDVEVGEVGVFVRGEDCFIKEYGKDGLISRNPEYPNVEPFSDGIRVVGRVIGKAVVINKTDI